MNGGYESIEWIRDEDGREFACYLEDINDPEHLTEEEKARCLVLNLEVLFLYEILKKILLKK